MSDKKKDSKKIKEDSKKETKKEESKEESKIFGHIDKKVLKDKKDFVNLANENSKIILDSMDPSSFAFSFLKESIEMLAPSLLSENISDLQTKIDLALKKKQKEVKPEEKKISKANIIIPNQRADKVGLEREYGGGEENKKEEEEYNEDEDFM